MAITWKSIDLNLSESAKDRISEIMEPYSEGEYCPMLSYCRELFEANGEREEIWEGWNVVANDYEGLSIAPSFYIVDEIKIYIASSQLIEPGRTLDFVDGEFKLDEAI